ncbi:MAG: hypothetical protein JWR65_3737 [Massilia sp.]|nr:hypothetical protein [Massilia sp.]
MRRRTQPRLLTRPATRKCRWPATVNPAAQKESPAAAVILHVDVDRHLAHVDAFDDAARQVQAGQQLAPGRCCDPRGRASPQVERHFLNFHSQGKSLPCGCARSSKICCIYTLQASNAGLVGTPCKADNSGRPWIFGALALPIFMRTPTAIEPDKDTDGRRQCVTEGPLSTYADSGQSWTLACVLLHENRERVIRIIAKRPPALVTQAFVQDDRFQ